MTDSAIVDWLREAAECLLEYAPPGEELRAKHVRALIVYFESGWTPSAAAEAVQASGGGFNA